ncbi:copper amine oxidase [Moniliophthora roreri]|uniref:Amine oxidase n=1 Tax=Moniliophthora roreri TaxID=221103 RepID=A0A0W0F404_MONRR|nr:copper amine oxidase [Moniliophthora roreri]
MPSYTGYQLVKDENVQQDGSQTGRKRRFRRGMFVLILLLVTLLLLPLNSPWTNSKVPTSAKQSEPLDQCTPPLPLPAKPPSPYNLWASLSVQETSEIQAWLEAPERNLNLTRAEDAALSDNTIFIIEAYYPSKAEALAHLESPDSVNPPERFARVTIHHGSAAEPVIKDYLVGPLPVSSKTTMRELTEIYHRDIPYNARGFLSLTEFLAMWSTFTPEFRGILEDLFNVTLSGDSTNTLVTTGSGPFSFDGSFRRTWVSYKRNVPGPWLHAIDFWNYFDVSGTDPSQWKVLKVVYGKQLFNTYESFLEAYRNGSLERPDRPETDDSWSTRKRVGERRDLDHLPGPRSVSFAGLRFRVDKEKQYVSWMGWGMYLGFNRDMGLSLWDIRFKGERIIYQLAPQEAIAQYGGNDPMQSTTAWQDRYFGMGSSVRDMLPGYDCPQEAVYLPATTRNPVGSVTVEKAICIFEQDTGTPITRHTGYMNGEFGAVKGYVLVVRSIASVGNYDYIFDYTFQLDGTIEVRVSASGYIQGSYWDSTQDAYGVKIRDTSMGNIHDHVINFKVDFDIVGLENSLLETTTSQEEVEQPWLDEDDDWGPTTIQQRVTKRFIENEDDALLRYPVNFQGGYAVVNQAEKNAWGYPRGYTIHPGYNPVHNTVIGSRRLLENANWARYNLAVSRRKDSEPSSSSMWNMNLPGNPVVNFHKFFDGENLTQEDLVAWINVGTHHLPQAEDSPNTKTNVATSSFVLTPLNYFDYDVSMESSNAILLSMPEEPGDAYPYDDYGVKQDFTCVPEPPKPFEYRPLQTFDVEGKKQKPKGIEELRKMAEMYHRVKVEL